MIIDATGQPAAPHPPEQAAAAAALQCVADHATVFEWDAERQGVDLRATNELPQGPNRARLKIFSPRPGTVVLFVYKDSQIPFSQDRFTYGAFICKSATIPADDLASLLSWITSGLHPENRPSAIKRAFPFDVPR